MLQPLKIATYNIHKGFSPFNRRHTAPELKRALDGLAADLVFLQEVQGLHLRHARRWHDWPEQPQHEYLRGHLQDSAYGCNAQYQDGHHGNALLSRYPIADWHNQDISVNRFERRGLLHGEITVPGWPQPLYAICVHLNLLAGDRRKQVSSLVQRVQQQVPATAPLIIAGDFNDWRQEASRTLTAELGMHEAHELHHGRVARSFPARLPLLQLDRIYVRGLHIEHAQLLSGEPWSRLSDHAPLLATVHWTH